MIALALADAKTITATFDRFCLIEGEIITFNTFHIDGHVHRDFFDTTGPGDDENGTTAPGEYSFWGSLRNHCFNLIRGKAHPSGIPVRLQPLPRKHRARDRTVRHRDPPGECTGAVSELSL